MSAASKLIQKVSEQADRAAERLMASHARLMDALDNGVPRLAEFQNALEALLEAHSDNCSACVKARMLLEPAVTVHHHRRRAT